jgi:hypothetical protein
MEVNKKTITSVFFVPTLKIPRDTITNNGFINAYSYDSHRDVQYEDAIYLLFKPTNLDKFREFLDSEYERTDYIIDDYDYEGGFTIVVYQLNPQFKADFDLIREGKYSKTSLEFQELFPRVIKLMKNGLHRDELSLQFRVFNRTGDLIEFWEKEFGMQFDKNQEIWTGFILEEETLDLTKIKEYV